MLCFFVEFDIIPLQARPNNVTNQRRIKDAARYYHCVKCVQIRSFFWSVFPVFSTNTGKYGPEKTPFFDTF